VLANHHDEPHRFRDEPIPIRSERAAGALARVKAALDTAIHAFQDARAVASEEGTPLPESIDDDIMTALVRADTLVRTQASLRRAKESHDAVVRPKRPALGLKLRVHARDGEST
jgi:hypothetical protein